MDTKCETSKAIQTWLAGVHEQSGVSREHDARRLHVLACLFVEKDPDQIIDECLREVENGKKIRAKGRRFDAQKITEFEQQAEGTASEKRHKANYIRSFLSHNGILSQTRPLV
ncbi:MAG: hypothetical protein NZ578_17035 [Candidatus Binatia bacterium]|nr:hypothetical protein [Candidatus Binatia bacterium]